MGGLGVRMMIIRRVFIRVNVLRWRGLLVLNFLLCAVLLGR